MTPKSSASRKRPEPARRSIAPKRIGPFEKPDSQRPLGQVGKRPTAPARLFVFTLVYFACGVASFFVLKGATGVIVGVVMIGISLLWLRGAATALLRQQRSGD